MDSVDHANYVLDKHIPRPPHSGPTALLSHTVITHPLSIWLMNSLLFRFYCHHWPTNWWQQRQQRCHIQRPSAQAHRSLTVSGCDTMLLSCPGFAALSWDATHRCRCPPMPRFGKRHVIAVPTPLHSNWWHVSHVSSGSGPGMSRQGVDSIGQRGSYFDQAYLLALLLTFIMTQNTGHDFPFWCRMLGIQRIHPRSLSLCSLAWVWAWNCGCGWVQAWMWMQV